MIKASDHKCVRCGKQATHFFPVIDPDIMSYPYCEKCIDELKHKMYMELLKIK